MQLALIAAVRASIADTLCCPLCKSGAKATVCDAAPRAVRTRCRSFQAMGPIREFVAQAGASSMGIQSLDKNNMRGCACAVHACVRFH